MKKQKALAHQ